MSRYTKFMKLSLVNLKRNYYKPISSFDLPGFTKELTQNTRSLILTSYISQLKVKKNTFFVRYTTILHEIVHLNKL